MHVSEFGTVLISDSSQTEIVICHSCTHCLFKWSLSPLLVSTCICTHTVCVFCFLDCMCVCSSLHSHNAHLAIYHCLPLRQQMLQPCHNSLELRSQTVSLGPLGSNLLTLQSAPQCSTSWANMLFYCALTLH